MHALNLISTQWYRVEIVVFPIHQRINLCYIKPPNFWCFLTTDTKHMEWHDHFSPIRLESILWDSIQKQSMYLRFHIVMWSEFLVLFSFSWLTLQFKNNLLFSNWLGNYCLDCEVLNTIGWVIFTFLNFIYLQDLQPVLTYTNIKQNNYWMKTTQIYLRIHFKAVPESSLCPLDNLCYITYLQACNFLFFL